MICFSSHRDSAFPSILVLLFPSFVSCTVQIDVLPDGDAPFVLALFLFRPTLKCMFFLSLKPSKQTPSFFYNKYNLVISSAGLLEDLLFHPYVMFNTSHGIYAAC